DFFVVSIARFKNGIDFDSLDNEKTFLIFLILGPNDKPGELLNLLASISKLLKDKTTKEKLLSTDQLDEFYKTIKNFDG
ncbi:PTS sugar transporter subunit IIA, partial [bacterium]|nr:PTS sugar transporter subunit IIA [bacterium]